MKIHKFKEIEGTRCIYPVGSNMKQAEMYVKTAAKRVVSIIEEEYSGKDVNIWCRGSSGAIIAALFYRYVVKNNPIIYHVKKKGEGCHCDNTKSYRTWGINIIVDDLISSGFTINEIRKAMHKMPEVVVVYKIELCSDTGYLFKPHHLVVAINESTYYE